MCPILKLSKHNEKQEIEFELRYLMSLSTRERFKMMFQKTEEMIRLLRKHGHSPDLFGIEVVKRTEGSGRTKDLEDLKFLQQIRKIKQEKKI